MDRATFDPETGNLALTQTLTDSGIVRIQAGQQGMELKSTELDGSLHGGRSEDVSIFAPGSGHDKIAHFTQGQDRLDLTAYGIFTAADLDGKVSVHGRVTTIQFTPDDSIQLIGRDSRDISPLTDADLVADDSEELTFVAAPDVTEFAKNAFIPVNARDDDLIATVPTALDELQITSASAPDVVTVTPDHSHLLVDTGSAFDDLSEDETTTFDVAHTVAGHSDDGLLI